MFVRCLQIQKSKSKQIIYTHYFLTVMYENISARTECRGVEFKTSARCSEEPGSDPGQEICYSDWGSHYFLSVTLRMF